MAIKAKTPLAPYWYTPKDEKDSANPTRFRIRALTGIECQDIEIHKDARGNYRVSATSANAILGYALLDWENLPHPESGEPLKFDMQDKAESLSWLHADIITELVWEVVVKSRLTEDQEKN